MKQLIVVLGVILGLAVWALADCPNGEWYGRCVASFDERVQKSLNIIRCVNLSEKRLKDELKGTEYSCAINLVGIQKLEQARKARLNANLDDTSTEFRVIDWVNARNGYNDWNCYKAEKEYGRTKNQRYYRGNRSAQMFLSTEINGKYGCHSPNNGGEFTKRK